jgi:hypothetical protein
MSNEDVEAAMPYMVRLLWSKTEFRETLQGAGMHLVPSNFYSSIPSIQEVRESYEYDEGALPYLDEQIFDAHRIRDCLEDLVRYARDFAPPQEGDEADGKVYFWNNSQFSYSDAMSYWAFIRKARPRTVVEIGSGFSSLVALQALECNGIGTLRCIEPYPRPFVEALAEDGRLQLSIKRAQDISAEALNEVLQDGDILFIDSTHTVKTGSDCAHIYLRLLPKIRRRLLVHVHDIFLPFGIPKEWLLERHIYWTEQYLLLAWLMDNPRTRVVFGSAYNAHFNGPMLDDFMNGQAVSGGSSFWFEFDGRAGSE